jgi:hypothetical protein
MIISQVITHTSTRVLTDDVRVSPVDAYLERQHVRLLWLLLIVAACLAIILH